MTKIFNSTLEQSLRILLILKSNGSNPISIDRISAYDFITLYSKYFGLSEELLQGDNEFGLSEYASRRKASDSAIKYLVTQGLVNVKTSDDSGISYYLSDLGNAIVEDMNNNYADMYKNLSSLTVNRFKSLDDLEVLQLVHMTSSRHIRR